MHDDGGAYLPARPALLPAARYDVIHLTGRPNDFAQNSDNRVKSRVGSPVESPQDTETWRMGQGQRGEKGSGAAPTGRISEVMVLYRSVSLRVSLPQGGCSVSPRASPTSGHPRAIGRNVELLSGASAYS
jgi:hypothetical protein